MNLKSNTEFGDYIDSQISNYKLNITNELNIMQAYQIRRNFDKFLKQSLEIWMFVPCKLVDGVLVVLEEPKEDMVIYNTGHLETDCNNFANDFNQYMEAKERVLFEGFELKKTNWNAADLIHLNKKENRVTVENKNYCYLDVKDFNSKTIEYLVKYDLQLTPTAIKQILN